MDVKQRALPPAACPGLVPDRSTTGAGPSRTGAGEQRGGAEGADGIRGGFNCRQFLPQRWLFRRAQQIHEKQNSSCREGDAEDPGDRAQIHIARDGPHGPRKGNRANQAQPFEDPANLRVGMRRLTTHLALPSFPKADRQNGDPEDVPHIEGPDGDGPARRFAPEAIVIAKCHSLWPETVGAAYEEHGDWSRAVVLYISPPRQGRRPISHPMDSAIESHCA